MSEMKTPYGCRARTTPATVWPGRKRAAFSSHVPSSSLCVSHTRRWTGSSEAYLPQPEKRGHAAAYIAEGAEGRKPGYDRGQDVAGTAALQDVIQRLLLRAAARQDRVPVRKKAGHVKADRAADPRQNGNIPRLPACDAARGLCSWDQPLAAAELHVQIVPLVAPDGRGLQDPALRHGEAQFLLGIPIRLRMQPFRQITIHRSFPRFSSNICRRGKEGDAVWTYRSAIFLS